MATTTVPQIASSIGKSGMFCGESRDLNMAVIVDFIKQNLRQG